MNKILTTTCIALLSFSAFAFAQDEHGHSDVEFTYENGAIHVEPSAEGLIFEGEFGTDLFSNTATEPGFAAEPEEGHGINPDDLVAFNVLDGLYYWNGTQLQPAGDTTLTIAGVGGSADVVVSATSDVQFANFATPANLVGQADSTGELHTDLSFSISDGALAGGYGLVISLSTDEPGISDSEPFGIFLNFGEMDEDLFESGVEAFAAVVPEPSSSSLAMAAFLFVCAIRGRRSRNSLAA